MRTLEITVRRVSLVSSRPFEEIVATLGARLGHPEMVNFHRLLVAARTAAELEDLVQASIGSAGLMEFARFDAGAVVGQKILRLLVGNPLIMREMARWVPDAAAYAPVTILVDERADGVHLSYDTMASLLAPYGSPECLSVATALDAKVEQLLAL